MHSQIHGRFALFILSEGLIHLSIMESLQFLCAQVFCDSVAPTLQSLEWIDRCEKGGHSFGTDGSTSAPCFTHLRNHCLSGIRFLDSFMLNAFLENNPRISGVGFRSGPEYANFSQTRGSILSLKQFDLWALDEDAGPTLRFLMANTQLSTLSFQHPIPAVFLDTQLLPLLCNLFFKLTSLSLS